MVAICEGGADCAQDYDGKDGNDDAGVGVEGADDGFHCEGGGCLAGLLRAGGAVCRTAGAGGSSAMELGWRERVGRVVVCGRSALSSSLEER